MTPTQQLIEDFQAQHQAVSLEKKELPWRKHLGMSQLGAECSRSLWYKFRWSVRPNFPPNVVRLFERGHREEERFVGYLRSVNIKVQEFHPETGQQFRTSHADGHVGGSCDGFGFGFIEYPNEWVILEFKTHGEKSFKDLVSKGVKMSKPVHWHQMNLYMRKWKLTKAFYMAVNKNTDELYTEWVTLDANAADEKLALSVDVVYGPIPERVALSSSDYRCRFCDERSLCWHRSGAEPARNCRTCIHSVPAKEGTWNCTYNSSEDIDCYNPCGAWEKRPEFNKPADVIMALQL